MLRNLSDVNQGSIKFAESRNTYSDEAQSSCCLLSFFRTICNFSDLQLFCFHLKKKKKSRQILVICRYWNITDITKNILHGHQRQVIHFILIVEHFNLFQNSDMSDITNVKA